VSLQSVISRIERESTRSNVEETRNEDDDNESRVEETIMSPSRIPDTPDQSMDTDRTILQATSSSGNISRRPAKRQGLGGSSRIMVKQIHSITLAFLYMKLFNNRIILNIKLQFRRWLTQKKMKTLIMNFRV